MPPIDLANPVWQWWLALTLTGAFNIALWFLVRRSALAALPAGEAGRAVRTMLALAGIYTVVCAFRGFMPRADVQRICLFDLWISTVFVGRSVATVAELAFVAQWSLALRRAAAAADAKLAHALAWVLVPLIAIAECFSWSAVITTNYLGNSVEESLWALCGVLAAAAAALLATRYQGRLRQAFIAACLGALAYVAFMVVRDVPMYLTRWAADEAAGKVYFSFAEGLRDVASRRVITFALEDWRDEIPWMSFYFSVAVWFSLALCRMPLDAPTLRRALAPADAALAVGSEQAPRPG